MNRKDTEKKLHEAIAETFTKPKNGYCWVKSHFDIFNTPNYMISQDTLREMTQCVLSKKDLRICPVHLRVHDGRRS